MKKYFIATLLALSLLASCVSHIESTKEAEEEPGKEVEDEQRAVLSEATVQEIVASNNTFAFNLLRQVYANEEDKEKNIFISPLSVSLAFAMLNNGAAGETRNEIQAALGFGDIPVEDMNAYFRATIDSMEKADPFVAFTSANAIWIDKTFPVLQPFKDVNVKEYDAGIENVTFADADVTAKLINDWCNARTKGMIPKIVEPIQLKDVVMALGNALYFKAAWTLPFPKEDTRDEAFNNQDGTKSLLPTMQLNEWLNYANEGDFKALELPYGNQKYAMQLFLPCGEMTVGELVESLDGKMATGLYPAKVQVKLPRFKAEYDRKLNDDLKALGIQSAFLPKADFTSLSTVPVLISQVLQKAVIDVNEEGTEAAAVTVIGAVTTSIDSNPPSFYADRPFVFLIREKQTGAIAFMGIIRNLR